MTRLQKKCLIAVAGTHLLAVVALLCSGFITSKPPPDDSQVLDVIPANLIDKALSSGVRDAQPPPPTPIVKPPDPTPIPPEQPKPEVRHVEPVKPPEIKPPEVEKPVDPTVPKPPKPTPHKVEVNLELHKNPADKAKSDAEAKAEKEAKRLQEQKRKAFLSAAHSIKENSSSSTTVEFKGENTVAYANYATIVKSVYTQAWTLPDDSASDDANVKVSITIARDGRIIESHIVDKSGDNSVDRSVQKTLDRVTEIAPFPDDSTDKERTYIINFNLKAKRQMLG